MPLKFVKKKGGAGALTPAKRTLRALAELRSSGVYITHITIDHAAGEIPSGTLRFQIEDINGEYKVASALYDGVHEKVTATSLQKQWG